MNTLERYRIAIVAPFPHPHIPLEGWMTRISSIDGRLAGIPRVYLHFSEHHDDTWCEVIERDAERAEARLKPLGEKSTGFMSDLVDAVDAVYVHTLHLAEHVLPWLDSGKVHVDIHGISPEEEEMLGNPHLRERYEAVEQAVLRGAKCCIGVSEAMTEHYSEKYPSIEPAWLTIPITPVVSADVGVSRPPTDDRRPAVLYAGGTQTWQNLDAMLDLAESAGDEADFRFLSHDHALIERRIRERGVTRPPSIGHCDRTKLPAAYRSADFGLVLRDDHPVNRVSCPTKLVEYLLFGLVPVVRSPRMGDFQRRGFAYVTEDEFRERFIPDAASREWMTEHNLSMVRGLAEQFQTGTRTLRAMLSDGTAHGAHHEDAVRRVKPSPRALVAHGSEFFLDLARTHCKEYLARKPEWVTRDQGALSLNFVMGLVKHFQPRSMLEIGVSAGLTSGAMLVASHTYDKGARVYGIDLNDTVYYQPTKRVGALVDEAFPELRPRLDLLLGKTSADIPDLFDHPIDFVYIDSLHSHPQPAIDALNSLTRMESGGVIAMDGVCFGAPGHDGSTYFFHHHDGEKLTFDGVQTGAIHVHDPGALFEHCCDVLELCWQEDVGESVLNKTVANIEAHFGAPKAERVREVFDRQHAHLKRFGRTYNVAVTTQWRYVEEMQRTALSARDGEPDPEPDLLTVDDSFPTLIHFRRSVLDRHARFPCDVLEVGAYRAPTVHPSEANVRFLDYYGTEELKSMAQEEGVDPTSVVPVDYVCRNDNYTEVVHEACDVLIANHVVEHVDFLIRWLQMARTLIRDGGLLFIVLPDKKKSFDKFRPDTPLSHLLFEHLAPSEDTSSVHTLESNLYYDRSFVGEENDPRISLDLEQLTQALNLRPCPPGVHRHVFQAETFSDKVLKPLMYMGLIDYELIEVVNCPGFGEFAVVLRAGRDGVPSDPGSIFTEAGDTVRPSATGTATGTDRA